MTFDSMKSSIKKMIKLTTESIEKYSDTIVYDNTHDAVNEMFESVEEFYLLFTQFKDMINVRWGERPKKDKEYNETTLSTVDKSLIDLHKLIADKSANSKTEDNVCTSKCNTVTNTNSEYIISLQQDLISTQRELIDAYKTINGYALNGNIQSNLNCKISTSQPQYDDSDVDDPIGFISDDNVSASKSLEISNTSNNSILPDQSRHVKNIRKVFETYHKSFDLDITDIELKCPEYVDKCAMILKSWYNNRIVDKKNNPQFKFDVTKFPEIITAFIIGCGRSFKHGDYESFKDSFALWRKEVLEGKLHLVPLVLRDFHQNGYSPEDLSVEALVMWEWLYKVSLHKLEDLEDPKVKLTKGSIYAIYEEMLDEDTFKCYIHESEEIVKNYRRDIC